MPKENSTLWEILTEPGAVFNFLNSNRVEFEIDMNTMPPLNLLEELAYIASFMKKSPKSRAYRAISDLTSLIVAAGAGKTYEMFSEIVIRDSLDQIDLTLERIFQMEKE